MEDEYIDDDFTEEDEEELTGGEVGGENEELNNKPEEKDESGDDAYAKSFDFEEYKPVPARDSLDAVLALLGDKGDEEIAGKIIGHFSSNGSEGGKEAKKPEEPENAGLEESPKVGANGFPLSDNNVEIVPDDFFFVTRLNLWTEHLIGEHEDKYADEETLKAAVREMALANVKREKREYEQLFEAETKKAEAQNESKHAELYKQTEQDMLATRKKVAANYAQLTGDNETGKKIAMAIDKKAGELLVEDYRQGRITKMGAVAPGVVEKYTLLAEVELRRTNEIFKIAQETRRSGKAERPEPGSSGLTPPPTNGSAVEPKKTDNRVTANLTPEESDQVDRLIAGMVRAGLNPDRERVIANQFGTRSKGRR